MIDLQHLRVLVRVSELGTFTKAAVSLGITQPSVSYTIRELERAWGGELFYRTGRGVALSEFGQHAVSRAKALVEESDRTFEELRAYGRLPSGTVTIGLPHSLVPAVLPQLLQNLRREAPGIHLKVRDAFSDQIERGLSEGDIDVGVCNRYGEGSVAAAGALFASPLVIASPDRSISLPPEVHFSDLPQYPLVLPAAPNGLRLFIDGIARRLRRPLNVVADADTINTQKQVCETCGLFMISSPRAFAGNDEAGMAVTSLIVQPFLHRSVDIVTTKHRPLSRAAREVARQTGTILKCLSRG
jgi:LysR family transcriptional regulator, nitrogen assimilation regulatory protein